MKAVELIKQPDEAEPLRGLFWCFVFNNRLYHSVKEFLTSPLCCWLKINSVDREFKTMS